MASLAVDEIKEPDWGRAEIAESYMVGPGIHYQKILYREKPLIIWFAEIDLSNPYNKVEQVENQVKLTIRKFNLMFGK